MLCLVLPVRQDKEVLVVVAALATCKAGVVVAVREELVQILVPQMGRAVLAVQVQQILLQVRLLHTLEVVAVVVAMILPLEAQVPVVLVVGVLEETQYLAQMV